MHGLGFTHFSLLRVGLQPLRNRVLIDHKLLICVRSGHQAMSVVEGIISMVDLVGKVTFLVVDLLLK
jgi:hypothetical protein